MKWAKLGKIFDPRHHTLLNGCVEFAQSPQVLLCKGYARIYFSTRVKEASGNKYRSHVAFVDMSEDFQRTFRVSDRPVLELGNLGCFDEHGIFPINVVRHGGLVYAYTCGWSRRVSVSVETSIGLAVSHDNGATFVRKGEGPVLTSSLHEPFLVGDGFVRVIGGVFHMWYIFGTCWQRPTANAQPERTYKIGHAISKEGVEWIKDEGRQIVADKLGPDESQALPTVIEIHGRYHMLFCYRESIGFRTDRTRGYRIGHASSDDLVNWSRHDDPIFGGADEEWDSHMQCYPHTVEINGNIYLLYNGNEFGRYGFGLAVLE